MSALEFLGERINFLNNTSGLRSARPCPAGAIDLASNDYLGFGGEPLQIPAVVSGARSSRLVSGTMPLHEHAEAALAEWTGFPTALLFPSGYTANVGLLQALCDEGTEVVSDERNHASIIDGCRLSRARITIVPHLDLQATREALRRSSCPRRVVVTEAYFSMDADCPDLSALRKVCDECGAALVVDEAHSLGIFGAEGAGACAAAGVSPDVLVGTLGKAVGLAGAFVAGPEALRMWMLARARSFVFSTGVFPALAAAIPDRVATVRASDGRRARTSTAANIMRTALGAAGVGPILPVVFGESARSLEISRRILQQVGAWAPAIRPPTVPEGTARIRFTPPSGLAPDAIKDLAVRVAECFT